MGEGQREREKSVRMLTGKIFNLDRMIDRPVHGDRMHINMQ